MSSMQTGRLHNPAKWLTCAVSLALGLSGTAVAQTSADEPETPSSDSPSATADAPEAMGTTIKGKRSATRDSGVERAATAVTRDDLVERQPRSAPDALRYEPGVFVQKTAHAQGSAFIRGVTGQQTLLMFDGVRLNNSTYRQGPNQYFFTLDAQTIESIMVQRGGASTRYGSDAIGGVIAARPLLAPRAPDGVLQVVPGLTLTGASADQSRGGRLQLAMSYGKDLRFLVGVGGRQVEELEGGGVLLAPETNEPVLVPMLRDDDRTQAGTGFDELTFDSRLDWKPSPQDQLSVAVYGYRQYDAPRTDQCPAAYAPYNECMVYEEQFRTLAYVKAQTRRVPIIKRTQLTLSWQQQHERKRLDRPNSFVQHTGRDGVTTLGVQLVGHTLAYPLAKKLKLKTQFGVDHYADVISSRAWTELTDLQVLVERSRGQYLNDARYQQGGVFADTHVEWRALSVLAGLRGSWVNAQAKGDPESGSLDVNNQWHPVTGHLGAKLKLSRVDAINLSFDRSFRAPNLDDLTSRQFTGPGFQFENVALKPERAQTLELGITRRSRALQWDLWAFRTELAEAIVRRPLPPEACPPETPGCEASWTRFQLINAADSSWIHGLEGGILVELVKGLRLRTTAAWAIGEGPNPALQSSAVGADQRARVPLSRIPPLNGTFELRWRPGERRGWYTGLGLRWAMLQDQLALSDTSDERIPAGGTPGFVVADLRMGYRFGAAWTISLVAENLTDAVYRYHGSAVNGPARGLKLGLNYRPKIGSKL